MQIFSIVGPLGSGKTTLTLNTFKALQDFGVVTQDTFAYVVNDEGAFVDGELARERAQVIAMTNGCFTCSDTADLQKTLEGLEESGIQWVFLEGFGITAGNETREFLESQKWTFHIVCTLSAQHLDRDLVRYADVVKSQAKAATEAIAVTKYPQEITDPIGLDEDGILQFIAEQNAGVPVVLLPGDNQVPEVITDIFTDNEKKVHHIASRHDAGCSCSHHDHNHDHEHYHHHEHAFYPYSFNLLETTSLRDIKECLGDKDFLLRIKGAVDGHLFNEIHGDWKQGIADDRHFVTFYSAKNLVLQDDLPNIFEIVQLPEVDSEDPSYLQLRKENGISKKETVAEIQRLLHELPQEPVTVKSGKYTRILTHPEIMQTLKDGIARRPSVKDEWFPKVLKECMVYWITCAEIIHEQRNNILPEDLGKNLRELSVSLVWWVQRHVDYFGDEMVDAVKKVRPGLMAIEGIQMMDSLNSDPERARWQHAELSEALVYAIEHGENPEMVFKAVNHCRSLAQTEEMKTTWSEQLNTLQTTY